MKAFTTIKVGYTTGIYGCSGEYFTTIIIKGNKQQTIHHYGMYGSEERINRLLKDNGFLEFYTPSDYGQMKQKDINKNMFLREEDAIIVIKAIDFSKNFRKIY